MSSNSIRAGSILFISARQKGLMSRSAAQQVEHWARLGESTEDAGQFVSQRVSILPNQNSSKATGETTEQQLWQLKRANQARDLENVHLVASPASA
ncbi:TA system antitoxin ParD family protein [Variovorax rhizosphaerae]|uniref:ParD-like antitoxin of type II toxin-antitoxin system n=1 Tax=Variovorax rhizosphaerae TaxID=1836200 RepID=A0ABU8WGF0_9BURK